jgi:A/G-specific adenine glycosylase
MSGREPKPEQLACRLLAWYDRARRGLPWRRTRNPYRVWVAEVMLQQTQVERVVPHYRRFVASFPTVRAAAAAPLDDILRAWSGLGYYSRARRLHAACRVIVERHSGRFPRLYADAVALPGVGEYTASAVLSIAYGQRLAAIDVNARRVLQRVFYRRGERAASARRRTERLGQAAVPAERAGDYNQAVMELGALICRPKRPRCGECCLADICRARRGGVQAAVPPPRSRSTRTGSAAAGIVRRGGRVLIAQRAPNGVWGGLWEFPNVELSQGGDPAAALRRLLLRDFGLRVKVMHPLKALTYGIMHRRIALTAYSCVATSGRTRARRHAKTRWVRPDQLEQFAWPSPHGNLARLLAAAP